MRKKNEGTKSKTRFSHTIRIFRFDFVPTVICNCDSNYSSRAKFPYKTGVEEPKGFTRTRFAKRNDIIVRSAGNVGLGCTFLRNCIALAHLHNFKIRTEIHPRCKSSRRSMPKSIKSENRCIAYSMGKRAWKSAFRIQALTLLLCAFASYGKTIEISPMWILRLIFIGIEWMRTSWSSM